MSEIVADNITTTTITVNMSELNQTDNNTILLSQNGDNDIVNHNPIPTNKEEEGEEEEDQLGDEHGDEQPKDELDQEEGEILEDGEVVDEDEDEEETAPKDHLSTTSGKEHGKGNTTGDTKDTHGGSKNSNKNRQDKTESGSSGNKKKDNKASSSSAKSSPSSSKSKVNQKNNANSRKRTRKGSAMDGDFNEENDPFTKGPKVAKKRSGFRSPSPSSTSQITDSNDDENDGNAPLSFSEEMMMQMWDQMQKMIQMAKEGGMPNSGPKKKKFMMMEKMMKNQASMNSREMREMMIRNRRLFRSPSRDRDRDRRSPMKRSRDRGPPVRIIDRRTMRDREHRKRERETRLRENRERENTNKEKRSNLKDQEREKGGGDRERINAGSPTSTAKNNVCRFFLDGKCHKGTDCPFSHDGQPPKKRDICKFYLQGFCGKGENCLFMHGEFPCKFFHTGADCYSGDNCRFSHQPLTDETRAILKNYLDSGELPDEYQGQNPQNMPNQPNQPGYNPMKPVGKRHAVLGDVTEEMKASYYTWVWQQEMKELELAYTGNKRNLFCIDKQFVVENKPSTPESCMHDYIEEHEHRDNVPKVMSFYIDTMGDNHTNQDEEEDKLLEMCFHDEDLRMPPAANLPPSTYQGEAFTEPYNQHFEQPYNEPYNEHIHNSNGQNLDHEIKIKSEPPISPTQADDTAHQQAPAIIPDNLPEAARNLLKRLRNQQKLGSSEDCESADNSLWNEVTGSFSSNQDSVSELKDNPEDSKDFIKKEIEDKKWLSDDSDDDTEDQPIIEAALERLQNKPSAHKKPNTGPKSKPRIDIAKMLNVIRETSNQMSGAVATSSSRTLPPTEPNNKQTEFWQNIFSGTPLASPGQPQSNSPQTKFKGPQIGSKKSSSTPPPIESRESTFRDPRLKKSSSKHSSDSSLLASPSSGSESNPSKQDSNSSSKKQSADAWDYKLKPLTIPAINYSSYMSLYEGDIKMKNDPRLQKFFNKSTSSVINHISNVVSRNSNTSSSSLPGLDMLNALKSSIEKKDSESASTLNISTSEKCNSESTVQITSIEAETTPLTSSLPHAFNDSLKSFK